MIMSNKKNEKVHYIYKIHFLCGFPSGRYYIGKRTGKINGSYAESGNFCYAYYKKYGKIPGKTYIKEILEINPSKGINCNREKYFIGKLWKDDPLCMNLCPGGAGNEYSGEQAAVKVSQYNIKTGELIKIWDSITEAESELGINNIGACCRHKRHVAGNWTWRYTSEGINKINPKECLWAQSRAVIQCDLQGNEIARFDRIQDAVIATGVDKKSIQECCIHRRKTGKGFIWKYVDENYKRKCNINFAKSGARAVLQIDSKTNKVIAEYYSVNEAARQTGYSSATMATISRKLLKPKTKYYWRYKENYASRTQ